VQVCKDFSNNQNGYKSQPNAFLLQEIEEIAYKLNIPVPKSIKEERQLLLHKRVVVKTELAAYKVFKRSTGSMR
jgi:hypothetical protein